MVAPDVISSPGKRVVGMLLIIVTMNMILWLARVTGESQIIFVYLFVYFLGFSIAFMGPIENLVLLLQYY